MQKDRTVRVTVMQVDEVFMAHATVVAGPGGGRYAQSAERRTEQVALVECFAKLVRCLAHAEREESEPGVIAIRPAADRDE